MWTRRIQLWKNYLKVFRNNSAPIIAWSPWMWSSDSKQKSLPKSIFGYEEYIKEKSARNLSLDVRKVLLEVGENRKNLNFQKNFFLEILPWIGRRKFQRLCWKILGKSLKCSLVKVENWFELSFFLHILFPQLVLLEMSNRSLRTMADFSTKNPRLYCWKHKIETFFFSGTVILTKVSSGHAECSFEDTSEIFCRQPEKHQLNVRKRREKVFFIRNSFFSFKNFLCNSSSRFR